MAAGEQELTWRPTLLGRLAAAALGLVFAVATVAAFVYGIRQPDAWAIVCSAMSIPAATFFLLSLRFRITVGRDGIEYRNFGPARRLRWDELVGVSAGYMGITMILSSQDQFGQSQRCTAMAVQKSNLSQWLGWRTRADRVVEQIAHRASGAPGKAAPPPDV